MKWHRLAAILLLGTLTIQADPFKTWSWTDPVEYVNNTPIPGGDLHQRKLYCGMQSGGPYPAEKVMDMQSAPSMDDMAFVVAGVAGTYYCVMTVESILYFTESGYSNEANFTVTQAQLGFVPKAITDFQIEINQ
jgi:hypothetical protein